MKKRAFALVVAVESYAKGSGLASLDGTVSRAHEFVGWLLNVRRADPRDVFLCTSPKPARRSPEIPRGVRTFPASREGIRSAAKQLVGWAPEGGADVFFYVSGHGGRVNGSDVLMASDYRSHDGDKCIRLDELRNDLLLAMGPDTHYWFVEACRNDVDFRVGDLAMTLRTSVKGKGDANTLFATAPGAPARAQSKFPQALLSSLHGDGRAKTFAEGSYWVTFPVVAEVVRDAVQPEGMMIDVQPAWTPGRILQLAAVPEVMVSVEIRGARDGEQYLLWFTGDRPPTRKLLTWPEQQIHVAPGRYYVSLLRDGTEETEPISFRRETAIPIYEPMVLKFDRNTPAGPPDPGLTIFGPSAPTALLRVTQASEDTWLGAGTSRHFDRLHGPLSMQLFDRDEPVISLERRSQRTLYSDEFLHGQFALSDLSRRAPAEDVVDPDSALKLSLLAAAAIGDVDPYAPMLAGLPKFDGLTPAQASFYAMTPPSGGVMTVHSDLQSAQLTLIEGVTPTSCHAAVPAGPAEPHRVHLQIPGADMIIPAVALAGRVTVIVVQPVPGAPSRSRWRVHQFALEPGHLAANDPATLLSAIRFSVLVQRRIDQGRHAMTAEPDREHAQLWAQLLAGRWPDPLTMLLAAYELVRRGALAGDDRGALLNLIESLREYGAAFAADLAVLDALATGHEPRYDGEPLVLDGLIALGGERAIPRPEGMALDYRGAWTRWQAWPSGQQAAVPRAGSKAAIAGSTSSKPAFSDAEVNDRRQNGNLRQLTSSRARPVDDHLPGRKPIGPGRIHGPRTVNLRAGIPLPRLQQSMARFARTASRRSSQSNVDPARRWHRKRSIVTVLEALSYVGAALLLAAVVWSLVVVIHGNSPIIWKDLNNRCARASLACASTSGFVAPVLVAALASAVFFFYRLRYVKSRVARNVKNWSRKLLQTAGSNNANIVGRDELCQVIMEDIRNRDARRPHVIVGGAGTGKTACLVRLTELLVEHGALPVPIRLQDIQENLDFRAIAWDSFRSMADARFPANGRAHKVWRQLCKDDQVVVVADGLEQAVNGDRPRQNREYLIRLAIRQAETDGLPLVIASRPHDPLQDLNATIMELEPLSQDAALEYLHQGAGSQDQRRIDWIVETAAVAEAPLYLQITRELEHAGLLDGGFSNGSSQRADTLSVDRPGLRLHMLDTWKNALVQGHLLPGVALSQEERMASVEQLSALACIGLRYGERKVNLERLQALANSPSDSAPVAPVIRKVSEELAKTGQPSLDVPLAAIRGERLRLVEAREEAVRFPHSILQAYLGSLLITEAMADPDFRKEALTNAGQELLMALAMRSRADAQNNARDTSGRGSPREQNEFRKLLRESVSERHKDAKAVDVYAALLEIDSADPAPEQQAIAKEILEDWQKFAEPDPRTLENAKHNLVSQFGEAARGVSHRRRRTACPARPAYSQLFKIGCREPSRPIQLAVVQQVGTGGDDSLSELDEDPGLGPGFNRETGEDEGETTYQRDVMRARVVPLLVESVTDRTLSATARGRLEQWLEFVSGEDGKSGRAPLSLEIALAQGFKYAANRRPAEVGALHETCMHLAERALEMLKAAEYWFSQLTLIQALCLLSLSDQPKHPADQHGAKPEAIVGHWLDVAGRGSTDHNRPASAPTRPHPFVREAARLAVLALKTRHPERYIWIDENEVVSKVGSYTATPDSRPKLSLWIPPSAGWAGLNARTQQLVADVVLMLNLADRGNQPRDSERRLDRSNRYDLPPCITRYRPALDPGRTLGTAASAAPGTNCVDGCAFELCPYPPKGAQPRTEISEAFCRRQQTLLSKVTMGRRRAPWQDMRRGQLVQFWAEMADRARGSQPKFSASA